VAKDRTPDPMMERRHPDSRLAEVRREALMRGDYEAAEVYRRAMSRSDTAPKSKPFRVVAFLIAAVGIGIFLVAGRLF